MMYVLYTSKQTRSSVLFRWGPWRTWPHWVCNEPQWMCLAESWHLGSDTHTHTLHGVFSCSSCFACSLRADSNRETKVELTNVSFLRMKGLQSQFCVWKDSSPSMNKTNNHTPPDIKQLFTAGWLADLRQLTCAIWSTKRAEDWTHFWFCMAHIEVWMRRMLLSWTCFGTLRRDIKIHSFWLWPWDQINMQQGVSDSMMEKQHSVNISQDKWTTSELQCCSVCGSKLKGYFAT